MLTLHKALKAIEKSIDDGTLQALFPYDRTISDSRKPCEYFMNLETAFVAPFAPQYEPSSRGCLMCAIGILSPNPDEHHNDEDIGHVVPGLNQSILDDLVEFQYYHDLATRYYPNNENLSQRKKSLKKYFRNVYEAIRDKTIPERHSKQSETAHINTYYPETCS